ncbi:hypothetical protein [Saccharibacillus kuerlensis]|uniref:Terpenoid synthase n=1 Tax=Saccharibacillus kuerlensis TaxID=459527 RepID=A0ABQ2L0W6_9BACL|nr:hypothetical protein [Saccharibacillus kuerlensis]GGN98812.1 hypothetical protein GCM10010969_18340 [Saccharibacillus kuerlensis]
MQLSVETRREMERAFETCRQMIAGFPAPFAEAGVRYLDRFDPSRSGGPTNYICCLLPYWLQQAAEASLERCREIAAANVFGMLHFHLQDERMDRSTGIDRIHIALSQLLSVEMNVRYSALFGSSEAFQSAMRLCTSEWAVGLAVEKVNNSFFERPRDIAARSAPLLLCPLVLLEENERLCSRALYAVQETLITLQMADDWTDYAEDLKEGSYNCLVAMYRHKYELAADTAVSPEEIETAVYTQGMLTEYAKFASLRQLKLEHYREDFPGLVGFHAALAGDLERIASSIEAEKHILALGGLNYWLLGR